MSSKNGYVNVSTASKKQQSKTDNLYCFIHFPKENTHGVWPQGLIRQKGSFSFEAKYGMKWFECKIEKEGTLAECKIAQQMLQTASDIQQNQWSSTETELSDVDENSSDMDASMEFDMQEQKKETMAAQRSKKRKKTITINSDEEEENFMKDISQSIADMKNRRATSSSIVAMKKKKFDNIINQEQFDIGQVHCNSNQSASSITTNSSTDIEANVMSALDVKLTELKNMVNKVYKMQKHASDPVRKNNALPSKEVLICNKINLISLPGKTPSRYLLSAARVVLTDEQFHNGYLPDFRGNKDGRVPIPQESVNTLKDAVRLRFNFGEEDMNNIWSTLRTSLVQKVTDLKKKRRSIEQQQQKQLEQQNLTQQNTI